ncbi:hypothetical protein AX15_000312 [Amanita polypyramis BW_CC]|nr:hypothetical protein AX15_000312 [Amanita polypyramis BW_CC]
MTAREVSATPFQSSPSSSRRTRPSQAGSDLKKRSPSPIISFTASPIRSDAKGVKNITQHVIKSLEGRFDFVDAQGRMVGIDEQVETSLEEEDYNAVQHTQPSVLRQRHKNGHAKTDGITANDIVQTDAAKNTVPQRQKVDWEIPRKLLHSSIGFVTLYLYMSKGSVRDTVLVLGSALAIIVPADIIRLRYPAFERLYERLLGFLMRESEKKTSNGVIWYILGVVFVLSFYPTDVATVAILILSWADSAASTFGRMFGPSTPPLPRRLPLLRLPLAQRKSVAGFIAASVTGACITAAFWGWVAPLRNSGADLSWTWRDGVRPMSSLLNWLGMEGSGVGGAKGWTGLGIITLAAGLVSGVAEALDLGSLDDNLTLPIISGGCILGFFKLVASLSR